MVDGLQVDPCCPIEIDFSNLRDVCTHMPLRLLVTGILVQWLRGHFVDPLNIENPFLVNSVWTPDIATTGMVIDSVFKWNPAQTEVRPGIVIKPGPWKVLRYGIDDRMIGDARLNAQGEVNPTRYNTMIQGSHTVFCIAGESAEVEILAAETYRELMQFGPLVRSMFNFLRFVVGDIGEPAILEEATENFVVPVTVSYGAQEVWHICPPTCQEVDAVMQNLWQTFES